MLIAALRRQLFVLIESTDRADFDRSAYPVGRKNSVRITKQPTDRRDATRRGLVLQ